LSGGKIPLNKGANNETVETDSKICCAKNTNSACFTFERMNDFWLNHVQQFCVYTKSSYYEIAKKDSTLYTADIFRYFVTNSMADIYAWLQFDTTARLSLQIICSLLLPNYDDILKVFESGFSFSFGTFNNASFGGY